MLGNEPREDRSCEGLAAGRAGGVWVTSASRESRVVAAECGSDLPKVVINRRPGGSLEGEPRVRPPVGFVADGPALCAGVGLGVNHVGFSYGATVFEPELSGFRRRPSPRGGRRNAGCG